MRRTAGGAANLAPSLLRVTRPAHRPFRCVDSSRRLVPHHLVPHHLFRSVGGARRLSLVLITSAHHLLTSTYQPITCFAVWAVLVASAVQTVRAIESPGPEDDRQCA